MFGAWFVTITATTAGPAAATTVEAVQKVPGTTVLTGIACPTATCIGVGYLQPSPDPATSTAVMVPITNGAAGAVQTLALPASAFGAVACTGATTCYALGTRSGIDTFPVPHTVTQAIVVPVTNGVLGSAQVVPGLTFTALTCVSAITCDAVGSNSRGQAVLVPIVDGVVGTSLVIPGIDTINAIACTSPTACLVTGTSLGSSGDQGVVVPITGGVPGTPQVADGITSFSGVACTSATTCFALGQNSSQAVVAPITDGVLGTPQLIGNAPGLNWLACMSATTCEAVGSADVGVVVPIVNGTPGAIRPVPGAAVLEGVACTGPLRCVAVGFTFDADGYTGVFVTIDEPPSGPGGPSACKNGGWKIFQSPAFKNQGDCVSYTQMVARCAKFDARSTRPEHAGHCPQSATS